MTLMRRVLWQRNHVHENLDRRGYRLWWQGSVVVVRHGEKEELVGRLYSLDAPGDAALREPSFGGGSMLSWADIWFGMC
jgi:hypothetical protein